MADLNSLTSLNTLISTIAGKHESAAVKADLALASTAVSLLAQTLLPRVDPSLNLTALDVGLAKAFDGITETVIAAETPLATTSTETTANA